MTVLVVEDEEKIRKNFVQYLTSKYKNILEASDGVEAYQIYKDNQIDFLITDINMPKMDGLTLIEKIREENRTIPIVVLSAHSEKEKLFRAIKLNLVEYIVKPVTRSSLKKVLNKIETQLQRDLDISLSNNYLFNLGSKTLTHNSIKIELTKKQALLIEILILNIEQYVSAEDIFYHIHPDDNIDYTNASIRNIIKNIRKLFPQEMIRSSYGVGYMISCKTEI